MNLKKKIRIIKLIFLILLLSPILFVLAVNYNFLGLFGEMPDLKPLEKPALASEIYSADHVLIGHLYRENRSYTAYEELSPHLVNALIALHGKNLNESLNYFVYISYSWSDHQGTLQNSKILGTLVKKVQEWLFKLKVRRTYTQEEIIKMYLNLAYFGHNAYGIHAAAYNYFDKHPSKLNPSESAILIGMIPAPTRYSPVMHPERAKKLRDKVLLKMKEKQFISNREYENFLNSPIKLKYGNLGEKNIAPHFKTELSKDLLGWAQSKGYNLYQDGLKIYTTIDSKMQAYAQEAVWEVMAKKQALFYEKWEGENPWVDVWDKELPNFIENEARKSVRYISLKAIYGKDSVKIYQEMNKPVKMRVLTLKQGNYAEIDTVMSPLDSIRHYKHFLQAGFIVMEPGTGEVKCWVGNVSYNHFPYDRVRASKRQAGSMHHSLLYATAIDNGYTPCFKIKVEYPSYFDEDKRKRLDYQNPLIPLKTAVMGYDMDVYWRARRTLEKYFSNEVIKEYGELLELDIQDTSSLGLNEVSLMKLLTSYCTYANRGIYSTPRMVTHIEDRHGNMIEDFETEGQTVLSDEVAYVVLDMLMNNTKSGGTSVSIHGYGTNRDNNVGWHNEIAAYSGTTQSNSDTWFIGMTQNLAGGVWVGGDTRATRFKTSAFAQGSVLALPIWGTFFQKIYADSELRAKYPKSMFERPEEISVELDCSKAKNNLFE